jgi:murein DD-endopeptidase MepM/ murein hydrolase activator NlpD
MSVRSSSPAAGARLLVLSLVAATLPAQAQQPGWDGGTYGGGRNGGGAYNGGSTGGYAASAATGVLGQLGAIEQELTAVRLEALELEERALALDLTREEHADQLTVADAQLARQRAEVTAWLSTLYRLHRRGLARVVFGAEDPTDLRRRATYLMSIVDASSTRMRAFLSSIDEHKRLLAEVEGDMAEIAALGTELEVKEQELEERRERRVELLGQINSQRNVGMQAMDEYSQVRQDLGGSWGGGWSGSSAGAAAPPAPSRAVVTPSPGSGTFRDAYGRLPWPTTGRVVRRFGTYTDPRSGRQEESMGVDLAADYGSPVRAVFEGRVQLAQYVSGYGQTVALKHGPFTTVYGHLSGLRVQPGQRVRSGDVIGLVGNSGLTDGDGYMLTFEVRYNDSAQDPLPWLARR